MERIYIVKWASHQRKLTEIDKFFGVLFIANICFGVFFCI